MKHKLNAQSNKKIKCMKGMQYKTGMNTDTLAFNLLGESSYGGLYLFS